MTFKHPNQFFIDNFYLQNDGKAKSPTSVYSKEHLDKKKKEKFAYFVESLTKEVKKSDNSKIAEIAKIFEYNTLSKAKNKKKYVVEEKQDIGNLSANFTYNGLLYNFNPNLNMFFNQYGHAIDKSQAKAFMGISEFEPFSNISDVDGTDKKIKSLLPAQPTNLEVINLENDLFQISFVNQDPNPDGFVIYVYQPDP